MPETPDAPTTLPEPDFLAKAPLAYLNPEFLDSPDGRLIRIMAEYQEPLVRFRRERIADTIVFFGSARFHALDVATHELKTVGNTAPPAEQAAGMAAVHMSHYYEDARTLARLISTWSKALPGPRHRFVVTSGGGPGIMEAANRGAWEAGAKSIGLNIKLPFEQVPNPYITPELNFEFHYFFMRKYWFAYLAKALVVFPGGFGTMDEMFELLTLAQTNKLTKKMTVILYGTDYWKSAINFEFFAENGAIAPQDLDLFQFADTPGHAFDLLKTGLTHHVEFQDPHEAHENAPKVPTTPAPTAQDLLGPDINKTRP